MQRAEQVAAVGSLPPIIQDGKLVGAVTHVPVNGPTTGYGIFIDNFTFCDIMAENHLSSEVSCDRTGYNC